MDEGVPVCIQPTHLLRLLDAVESVPEIVADAKVAE